MDSSQQNTHQGALPGQQLAGLLAGYFKTMFTLQEIPIALQKEAAHLLGLPTREEFDSLKDTVQRLEGKIRRLERQAALQPGKKKGN